MVFSSPSFLFYFLPLALIAYFLTPRAAKNYTLLIASLVFYTWGGGYLVLLMLLSISLNYGFGFLAASELARSRADIKRLSIFLSVATNLGILGFYKYSNFFVEQTNKLFSFLDIETVAWTSVLLPVGISFYTFQSMSYVMDVSRGESKPLKNPFDFALYVSMFPQLISGPIVRYGGIADQLRKRSSNLDGIILGAQRFAWGLVKKVVVADSAGEIAGAAFAIPSGDLTFATAWIGIFAYAIQIYFDFSAYSDMAIGLGRILGFKFPENFNRPYSALSMTDFWRRWHMTLSSWFRDYLYIPLGGSRKSSKRTFLNLWIVFAATGIWHGANWTFLIWGLFHGAILVIERISGSRKGPKASFPIARRCLTLFLVLIGWVLFRCESLSYAIEYYSAMFGGHSGATLLHTSIAEVLTSRNIVFLLLGSLVFFLPGNFSGWRFMSERKTAAVHAIGSVFLVSSFAYALALIAAGNFTAFLYFRF